MRVMKEALKRSYDPSKLKFKKTGRLLLKNGRIVEFVKKQILPADVLIVNGKIAHIGNISDADARGEILDLGGKLILPGMMDMHVHFREPGREDEETLMTGAAAAMAGGFTGVCTMPNTEPATDNKEIVESIVDGFKGHLMNVHPVAAISRNRQGEQLVEMAELIDAGVCAFSDDGSAVANPQLLRRALEYSRMFDTLIIEHCEDKRLSADGVMHEGFMSTKLGLPGIPSISEELIVARDIMFAHYTQTKIHIAHISTAGAVELVRQAKSQGIQVSCEVTPHHFTLTDEQLESYDTNLKMSPPLRTRADVEAIIRGLKDGTIDVIATDHAPHSAEEKECEFAAAPFGILGLETALGLAISELINKYQMSFFDVFEKFCLNPYRILNVSIPAIATDASANLSIIDPEQEWEVDKNRFKSRSRNTPFHGWKLTGKSWAVINKGLYLINED